MFKIGSCGWHTNNEWNLISKGIGSCYKVIMTEKNDEVIEVHSSLMTGVARMICNDKIQRTNSPNHLGVLSLEEIKHFIKSLKFITVLEHDLHNVIDYTVKNLINMT